MAVSLSTEESTDESSSEPTEESSDESTSETAKQYRFEPEAMDNLLREFASLIPDSEIPLRTRLESEAEFLGYISYTNPKLKNTGFVLDVNTKYSPKIAIYHLDILKKEKLILHRHQGRKVLYCLNIKQPSKEKTIRRQRTRVLTFLTRPSSNPERAQR